MTNVLIKAGAGNQSVRSFAAPSALSPQPRPEDILLAALRQENEELKAALAQAREAIPEARDQGREEGRREALDAAKRDDEARLKALRDGIGQAVAAWESRLDQLDGLAALLARSALAKLFDQSRDQADFVARAIARQIGLLRRETVVAIRVSRDDFEDEAALAALFARAATGSIGIVPDGDLAAGECRIDLQLGHIDLGIRAQWDQLSDLLLNLAHEEAA